MENFNMKFLSVSLVNEGVGLALKKKQQTND